MAAIRTEGLTKIYRSDIGRRQAKSLDNLTLHIAPNEVFGFLGRNGAGKTTAIKILCSLLRPSAGQAQILGEPARSRRARRHIGYLPENPYFYEYLTPRETIDFYGRLHGLSAARRAERWKTLAEQLDLGAIAGQRVRGFSKGMRQRLGFAVALVGDPEILILDEPMSGLDPMGRRSIRELILHLRDQGKTLFFSSHVLGDVEQICDRVGILVRGRLISEGRIDTLLTRKIEHVEVVATGIEDDALEDVKRSATGHRVSEAGHHFLAADLDQANLLARKIQESGGTLSEFTPVKETLEDYFVRQQEPAEQEPRA